MRTFTKMVPWPAGLMSSELQARPWDREIRFLPFPESFVLIHQLFHELAANDFLIPQKQWLHAAEIVALAKFIILEGTALEIPHYDLVPPLNSYKTLWRVAEEATAGPAHESEGG